MIYLIVLLADQLHKYIMLHVVRITVTGPIEVTPFFNLVMVWNPGVSFGLFNDGAEETKWMLIGVATVIVVILLRWLWQQPPKFVAMAIGLIIGGAIGNVVDRFIYGAVADFFDFHISGYHWPAFNIADSAIFIGVVLLIIDAFFLEPRRTKACNKHGDDG